MGTLHVEIYRKNKKEIVDLSELYYQLGTKYCRNITICEYVYKDGSVKYTGNIRPKEIKKYYYKYYRSKKNIKLPCKLYKNYWDSLFIENTLKYKILNYAFLIKKLERKHVDFIKMGINRCILIKGEPGTGKSTLARAIAQKIAIRTKSHFLFEINCAELFSKFFGESSEKITGIFKEIKNKRAIIIIDEIETLLISRERSLNSNDPIDSIRAVNSFLLNIDGLRTEKNILFIYTSNFSDMLDSAFLSRMDLTIELPFLKDKMLYDFIKNFIEELMNKNIIKYEKIPDYEFDRSENNSVLFSVFNKLHVFSPRKIKKLLVESLLHNPTSLNDILKFILSKY